MDISYLLLLQNFREATGNVLSPFFDFMSKFAVGFIPISIAILIFWAVDRNAGRKILAGFGGGLLINGFLKLTFCVYRPWIRDARINPYGDAKVAATGYSFPSGHSTWATGLMGGIGYFLRVYSKIAAAICFLGVASVLLSRNYLGVHTPQDVVVGFLSTAAMMFVIRKLEDWSDKDARRDLYILIGGIALCLALVLYYEFKIYPLQYLSDGSLLVDPVVMRADSFEGIGFICSYCICRFFEKRKLNFDQVLPAKQRLVIGAAALVPLYFWSKNAVAIGESILNKSLGKFLFFFVAVFYIMILVPLFMQAVAAIEKKAGLINKAEKIPA